MVNQEEVEKVLRQDFLECLQENNEYDTEILVDKLINVLKKDYLLLHSNPLYCKDCFNCNKSVNYGFSIYDSYCSYYEKRVNSLSICNHCSHYLNGELEAKKSISVLHKELTKEWIQDV